MQIYNSEHMMISLFKAKLTMRLREKLVTSVSECGNGEVFSRAPLKALAELASLLDCTLPRLATLSDLLLVPSPYRHTNIFPNMFYTASRDQQYSMLQLHIFL